VTFVVGAARKQDPARAEAEAPALWRESRRFNLPIKMALAAAHEVARAARDPAEALLVSLAPCRPGSPELWRAAHAFETALARTGRASEVRVNPTYTLHAIDNLGLSALAMALHNRAPCLGLGGAAGQGWCALEAIGERFEAGEVSEALLFAGDQDPDGTRAAGAGILFAAEARPFAGGRAVRLVGLERQRLDQPASPEPDAAGGLLRWLAALEAQGPGRFAYPVPDRDGDGLDRLTVVAEVA
jgi:hypothetical protein